MAIQVGHPHECPTFFLCPQGEVNESTGQRVNKFASWRVNKLVSDRSDKSDSSDATKCKSPLAPKICAICGIYKSQYQLDTISQTERTVPLVCETAPDDGDFDALRPVLITDSTSEIADDPEKPNTVKFAWRYAENRIAQRNPLGVGIFTEPYDYTFR